MDNPLQPARPQSIFILVPGVGTKPADDWNDEAERPWLHSLPPSISSGMSAYAFYHGLTARGFAWAQLLGKGVELLKLLVEASEEQAKCASAANEDPRLPIVVIAHSIGGFIVKEALCLALEQKNQYSGLLKTLAGIVFLGTPHSISKDDEIWGGIPYAIDQSSKAKNLISPEAWNNLAKLSIRFMEAAAELQVLSCYELEKTSVKSSLFWSSQIFVAPRDFVQLKSLRERLLALPTDHKGLCDFKVPSSEFTELTSFLETTLGDARVRITSGSPEYAVPAALPALTVKDVGDIEPMDWERYHDKCGRGNGSAKTPSDPQATKSSSDASIRDLHDVSSFTSTLPDPKLPCYTALPSRNAGFYGRASVLKCLDKVFLERREHMESVSYSGQELTRFALVGPGGMGKTQVAIEFVHLRKDRFDAIFWVHADQQVKLANGFLRIALQLGLIREDSSDANDPVVVRETVKGWMANPVKSYETSEKSIEKASWLLVFDNADDADVFGDYRPVDGPGCVLLTSRCPFQDSIDNSTLQPFSPEDSFNFLIMLTKRKGDPRERQAGMEVAHKLGGLPLAVTQMAGIITRRDLSFAEFLAAYGEREKQEEFFETKMDSPLTRRKSEYGHTLASVWALESLKHGRTLLDVLSFLDPDQIPESILTAFLAREPSSIDPPLLHEYPRSDAGYERARTELLQSSLISRQITTQSMSVHGLVQDVSRAKLNAPRLRLTFITCLHLLSAKWPFESFGWQHSVARWSTYKELFPHVMRLMNLSDGIEGLENDASTKFRLAKLLTGAGRFYHESGSSLEALPFFDKAQGFGEYVRCNLTADMVTEGNISSEDVEAMLAEIHYNVGCVATETNNPKNAILHFTNFNEMMAEEARTHDKQKEYAISWNELGVAQMMNKEWKEAEKCFLRSIEIMKEVDASAKELQSFPTVNLGLSYWLQGGRLEEANAVLIDGLRDREAIYGINDRESFITGRFLHAIGNVKADLAKMNGDDSLLEESRAYHRRALSHYKETVGNNHHRTADTCVKVADHCMRLNMLEAAGSLLDQALKVFTSRPVYLAERARATFKKSRVLEFRGLAEKASLEREASFRLLQRLTDLKGKTVANVSDLDFDEVLCFWSR